MKKKLINEIYTYCKYDINFIAENLFNRINHLKAKGNLLTFNYDNKIKMIKKWMK